MVFGSVYPMYITKVERKGRTKEELDIVIKWLTGYTEKKIQTMIDKNVSFETFFEKAKLNPNANLITGMICGYRIEEIENPITRKVRYLDKLVDELANGRPLEKILRKAEPSNSEKKVTAEAITKYNKSQNKNTKEICEFLQSNIDKFLKKSESKVWHGTPVWFIAGNPIVSYSVRKDGRVSLMFFSGQSFDEPNLMPEGKFKAAEIFYTDIKDIKITHLKKWLKKSSEIQWDYKNIVKRKGILERI